MGALRIISLHTILGPPDHFLHLLYGAPQISFFSYNMGSPLRSVSLHAIWGATSHFSCFTKYMGSPQISLCILFGGALSDNFFLYGAPSDQFFCILYREPLRSVSSPTIWGSPEISFFAYYMRPPSVQFLRLLYGGPIRSVSLQTI